MAQFTGKGVFALRIIAGTIIIITKIAEGEARDKTVASASSVLLLGVLV